MTKYFNSETYAKQMVEIYGKTRISMVDLIEGIIKGFGKDIGGKISSEEISEDDLNHILSILLGDSKDISFAVCLDPKFSSIYKFEYDTIDRKGYISCINEQNNDSCAF
tara:strand:+ start:263 stop:589 length:327 start_codon:yes stop_codon:yes gene_type:complete